VAEIRRRIDGCRERLRRNRAARRIAERATPHTFETAEELAELALLAAATEVRGEET
jgi:Flp pilus assembly CpaE family ATPase